MKGELSVKKCASEIFWGIVLHSIWIGILLSIAGSIVTPLLPKDSVIVENIVSLILGAVTTLLAAKVANKGIVKKYTMETSILPSVTKRLWTIVAILGVIAIIVRLLLVPVLLDYEIEKLENANSIFNIYDDEDIQQIRDEAEASLPSTYANIVVFGLLTIGVEFVIIKFATFDLKQKYTAKQSKAA